MNQDCPNVINCPGTDNPFANLSSEGIDAAYFKRVYFFKDTPPIGDTYSKLACAVVFNSTVSQQDADEQAAIAAALCVHDTWNEPDTGGGGGGAVQTYFNAPQSCSVPCPDGSLFTYTVGYGRYSGLTQVQANQSAYSAACQLARLHKLCLSDLPKAICSNVGITLAIYASASLNGGTLLWQLVGGSIPTGMTFNGGALASTHVTITGTPTAPGSYNFSVSCTAQNGDFMVRVYTLDVAGITNTLPLAEGTLNDPYSSQLTVFGFAFPVFTLVSGALPDGLTMDFDGLITGTPTTVENPNFVIKVEEFLP